jgi:hypothetical protein
LKEVSLTKGVLPGPMVPLDLAGGLAVAASIRGLWLVKDQEGATARGP